MNLYQPTITGSLSVSGSINISGSINVVGGGGTITGTASYATNAELLDGLDSTVFTLTSSFAAQTASFTAFTSSILSYTASQNILNGTYTLTSSFAAQTASFTAFTSSVNTFTASINSFSASVLSYTSSLNAKTSSFATTGSNTFEGIQTINSNLTVTGSITAQTLIVSTINATQSYSSGSNIFGNASSNTQTFTGSVNITGSLTVVTTGTEFQVNTSGVNLGNALTDSHIISGSLTVNPSGLFVSSSGLVGIGTTSPSSKLHVVGSSLTDTFRITDASNYTIVMGYSGSANVGMISTLGSTAKLALGTNSAARLTIEGTGKVGISTSVAGDVLLNVVNGSSTGYGMNISAGSGSGNYALRVENYNGASTLLYVRGDGNILINDTSANSYAKLQVTATSGVVLGLANPSAASADTGNVIQAWGTSGYNTLGEIDFLWDGATNTYAYMAFKTRGPSLIERMRITSGGILLLNTTSTSTTNTSSIILRTGTGAYDGVIIMNHATTNNTGAGFLDCYYNTTYIGGIGQNGASNVAFYTSSDYRLKEDLKDFVGLNLISNLKVYDFKWKEEDSRMYGVIAHELQEIMPYAVSGNKDEIKENGKIKVQVVDYSKLVPVLIKAIQELKAEIDELKNK